MKKSVKLAFCVALTGVLGVSLLVPACKTRGPSRDSDSNLSASAAGGIDKNLLKSQIESFDETRRELVAANQNKLSACEKLDILWSKIVETKQDDNNILPANSNFKEVVTFGNGSALRFWRIFEGWGESEGGSEIRPVDPKDPMKFVRLTHRFGVLAKMKFVVDKSAVQKLGYTGQYAEGNDCVLGRLSSAVPTGVADRFTPAVSAKFFLGGSAESQVLIAQHDIGGQSSGTDFTVNPPRDKSIDNNFYTKYLSNRLSFEKGVLSGVGAFSRFFYTAQYFSKNILKLQYTFDPRELQANHLANKNRAGEDITAPRGPRFIWLSAPSEALKKEFSEMAARDLDFRKHFLSLNPRLNGGTLSMPVFSVYASDTWTYEPEKDATLIGQLVSNSAFVVSEAADVRLFFKHASQFVPIPDEGGKPSPYTQDYAYSEWTESLFAQDCRLGILAHEVNPSARNELNGSFLTGAIVNPATQRKDKNGKPCIVDFVGKKVGSSIEAKTKELEDMFEKRTQELEDNLAPYFKNL